MTSSGNQQIVPGIFVTSSGQATVDASMSDVLFHLALELEEPTRLPVDVEHVLAAIVLAARGGDLASDTSLSADDPTLVEILGQYVKTVFEKYGGTVGNHD